MLFKNYTFVLSLSLIICNITMCAEKQLILASITTELPRVHVVPDILGAKIDGDHFVIEERMKLYQPNGRFTEQSKFLDILCNLEQQTLLHNHWKYRGTTYVEVYDKYYKKSTWFTIENHRKK